MIEGPFAYFLELCLSLYDRVSWNELIAMHLIIELEDCRVVVFGLNISEL